MLFPFSGVQMQQRHTPPLGLSRHCVEGQVGHQSSLDNSPGSTRIDLRPHEPRLVSVVAVLLCGFGRGVRVVGSGDFARFVAFLPL